MGRTARIAFALALALAAPAAPATAQEPLAPIAASLVRALAPATDDPDAVVRDLVATALANRRSPAAAVLVEEAIRRSGSLQQPLALRATLPAEDLERRGDLVAQRLTELAAQLDRARSEPDHTAALAAGADFAGELLVAGPFGDAGDHLVAVPCAPDLVFPPLGTVLPGRGVDAHVRLVRRHPHRRTVDLADPARPVPGAWFALQRVTCDAPVQAFLEVECDGDHRVTVDGTERLVVEHWRTPAPSRHWLALDIPAGMHTVVVKTGSLTTRRIALRWVDARGGALRLLREVPPTTPVPAGQAPATAADHAFASPAATLLAAAAAADATPALRIAALAAALRDRAGDAALRLHAALRSAPPEAPTDRLAWAQLVPRLDLPDEQRAAEARTLEESAAAALPPDHHHARLVGARLASQQDQHEAALRLYAAHPAPGPETFAAWHALLRRLRFAGDDVRLRQRWRTACPHDPAPLLVQAQDARQVGDSRTAFTHLQAALALRADAGEPDFEALRAAFRDALHLGDIGLAAQWLDRLVPVPAGHEPGPERLRLELDFARARGDADGERRLLAAMVAHPERTTGHLERAAERLLGLGDTDAAVRALQQSLTLLPDQPRVRAWLHQLGHGTADGAVLAQFRRDGDAVRRAFVAGPREQGAPSTLVIDQRLVELRADGSWTAEVHELRRINDLAGVEAHRTAGIPKQAAEVRLVRTIAPDGQEFVPAKVNGEYTMPRLEPGSFVEWRYAEAGEAPGVEALQLGRFWFRSPAEPFVTSDYVLVLPKDARGELRSRRLGAPTRDEALPDGRRVLGFTVTDSPRLPPDRMTPPLDDLVPMAEYGEDAVPLAALRSLRTQVWRLTRPTPPVHEQLAALRGTGSDARSTLAAIHAFCHADLEDGDGGDATHTILRRKGSRFLAFVALVRAADLPCEVLACEAAHASLQDDGEALFTADDAFGVPGLCVRPDAGPPVYVLYDTPRHWPLGAIPAERGHARCWHLGDGPPVPDRLPAAATLPQTIDFRGTARVVDDQLHLQGTLTLGDVQGFAIVEQLRQIDEKRRGLVARQFAQQTFPGWRVQQAAAALDAPGQPLRVTMQVRKACDRRDGDRLLVPWPFPSLDLAATYGDRAERTLPLRLTSGLIATATVAFDAGAGMQVVEVPTEFVQCGPLLFTQGHALAATAVHLHRTARIDPDTLPAERFGEWLQALTAIEQAEQGHLVLAPR
jgi:tetratricopeptide (TPR) repeat protein